MQVITFLVEVMNEPVSENAGVVAARVGHVECLAYLRSQGLKLTKLICIASCKGGHFACAKYVMDADEKWFNWASWGAFYGNFECVKYAIQHFDRSDEDLGEHGFLIEICKAFKDAAEAGQVKCLQLMLAEWKHPSYRTALVERAAMWGQLDVLILANEMGVELSAFQIALKDVMDVKCLKYLHELGCTLTAGMAADNARELFHYLIENNCPRDPEVCKILAWQGDLDLLKYAFEHGCPGDEAVCAAAAEEGHLHCLKFAHENGCPWSIVDQDEVAFVDYNWGAICDGDSPIISRHIAVSAANAPSVDCLRYVVEQGVPLHPDCGKVALWARCKETLHFLHSRGFTWGEQDCETEYDREFLKPKV